MVGLPGPVIYGFLALGAALENVVPPVPADTFVLLGGFLAGMSDLSATLVFVATWLANVASALAMYRVGHTHGRTFFELGYGRHLLNRRQMERMQRFYERWGTLAIFLTRFVPGVRSVVPVFAGVTHRRFLPVAVPLAAASGIWYGALVWAGAMAGSNLDVVVAWVTNVNRLLLAVALILVVAVGVWWRRSR